MECSLSQFFLLPPSCRNWDVGTMVGAQAHTLEHELGQCINDLPVVLFPTSPRDLVGKAGGLGLLGI